MQKLIIIGSGGFATEAAWAATEMNRVSNADWELLGYLDEASAKTGSIIGGLPVLGNLAYGLSLWDAEPISYFCAIGDNRVRARVVSQITSDWTAATLIHPSAIIAASATIGAGTYVGAGAVICPNANIARHVLINVHASIGHDCRMDEFSQACPGVRISGNCIIEEQAFLGSNASVAPGITIGSYAKVGLNSGVMRNVKRGVTVVGVPAQPLACPAPPARAAAGISTASH